jgi:hypothetical protein
MCIAACCDKNNINSDLLAQLYEQFEVFLHWLILTYGKQTTTIYGLILYDSNWPLYIRLKDLYYVLLPKDNPDLHKEIRPPLLYECKKLICLGLTHYHWNFNPSLDHYYIRTPG